MKNSDKFPTHNLKGRGGKLEAWSVARLQKSLGFSEGKSGRRQVERLINRYNLLPQAQNLETLAETIAGFRNNVAIELINATIKKKGKVVFLQLGEFSKGNKILLANDGRGGRHWVFDESFSNHDDFFKEALRALQKAFGKNLLIFAPLELMNALRACAIDDKKITLAFAAYPEPLPEPSSPKPKKRGAKTALTHLDNLEAEAIHIMREVVAEMNNPVMLYSLGKDSSVMLHLALKAFAPSKLPFPLLHIDTGWKFQAMYDFRQYIAEHAGIKLIAYKNPQGARRNINPFEHGSALHTEVMKTEALKQALEAHGFDAAFGGARRDEEKSRAKERIFSFRNAHHEWDPKNQRPELWSLYNTQITPPESIRVFPLSNWTELDIWHYILRESIAVVPLYFAAPRPIIERDGALIMVDDDRMPIASSERIKIEKVRFRTLGCYPLTGAIRSTAASVEDIISELITANHSERQGRVIDKDQSASMETKKREGYF